MFGQLILIQIITFIFLIVFLRLLFHRHLNFALTRLHRINQDVFEKEEILKKKYQEMEKEREEKIKEAEQEVERIKNKARKEILGIKDKILEEAYKEKSRVIEQAIADAKKRKKEIEVRVAQKSTSLASNLIEYIFSKEIKQGVHIQLVDELIEELHATRYTFTPLNNPPQAEFNGASATNQKQVETTSVYPLKVEQKKRLIKTLSEKLGQNIELKEKIDKKMIGGVIIKLGNLVLDGSLSNKLQRAIKKLVELQGRNS